MNYYKVFKLRKLESTILGWEYIILIERYLDKKYEGFFYQDSKNKKVACTQYSYNGVVYEVSINEKKEVTFNYSTSFDIDELMEEVSYDIYEFVGEVSGLLEFQNTFLNKK